MSVQIIGVEELNTNVKKWLNITNSTVHQKIRHAISETIDEVGDNVRRGLQNTDLNIYTPMPEGGTLYEGVSQYMYRKKTEDAASVGVISILGNRKTNDGTWRLRFFECGTQKRYNKANGKYLGQITPRWFFRNSTNDIESILTDNVEDAIKDAVDKINNDTI